jgi:uncharacterized repeat protein (TIGR02543 family)
MRFLTGALIPAVMTILITACDSPASPKPEIPPVTPAAPPKEAVNHAVTYFGNENTAGEAPVNDQKYIGGQKVALSERGGLYRVGYSFTGWNTRADGSGAQYKENEEFTIGTEPVKFYAQWEEVFPRISAGENFSILVTSEGKLYAAGANGNGRLGDGTSTERREFIAVDGAKITAPVQWVNSGQDHSFAILGDGGVVGWGRGDLGKLGLDRDDGDSPVPAVPTFSGTIGMSAPGEIIYVSAGRSQTALLNKKGEYWAAGSRNSGALGNGVAYPGNREKQFKLIQKDVVSIAAGQNYILLVKKDGALWIAGDGANGRLGAGSNETATTLRRNIALGFENKAVFAGKNNHSMIIMGSNNAVLSAGNNSSGQLGHGGTIATNYFRAVISAEGTELEDVAFVSLGNEHSMILQNDGSLWAVGRNNDTQLGITPPVNQNKAVKVLENVAYVAAGYNHTLAVKDDGSLWAAGSNNNGQFGQKTSARNNLWTRIDISAILPSPPAPPPAAPATP